MKASVAPRILAGVLFLEEVFERLAGVQRAGRGHGSGWNVVGLSVGGWSGVLFDRGAKAVEGAAVFYVLRGDALGHGLRTLKAHAGVKEAALLAAVQLELAFRAGAVGVKAGSQNGAAIGAARARYRAHHARGAGAELIGAARTARGRLFTGLFFFFFIFRVSIAAVTVLAIHTYLRPCDSTDCYNSLPNFE
jgi:hypothetical protein